ncbi:hypothetical protein EYF80_020278 [Liparis tanakae]|uniref:Uncharacterized protein n=1 Tax=Liparis tanakae TaxID=230148 RepID=A0A4Z2HWQ7_9TELE|nr:hypothetical protein EYF80_020278 [Liparis tanakae]
MTIPTKCSNITAPESIAVSSFDIQKPLLSVCPSLYLYLLSTTTLHHSALAITKSCSSTAQHVALCRRVNGLRGGRSHRDSHRSLTRTYCSSHAGDRPDGGGETMVRQTFVRPVYTSA